MKYENAKDILPAQLLEELQKYAAGKLLYVPLGDKKRNWGEASGHKEKLEKRNRLICSKYANGMTISELADEYFLSLDSIKKIIYSKNRNKNLEYSYSMECAIEYSNAGICEEWIRLFLKETCNADKISKAVLEESYIIFGLAKLPLRLIDNNSDIKTYNISSESYLCSGTSNPPLIVEFEHGKFKVMIQEKLFMELNKFKVNAYPLFILIKDHEHYKVFMKMYGCHLVCDTKYF